jgi:hypothetical protein
MSQTFSEVIGVLITVAILSRLDIVFAIIYNIFNFRR